MVFYSKEVQAKIIDLVKKLFTAVINSQGIEFPKDKFFNETRGVRVRIYYNGKFYTETVFPKNNISLLQNLIEAVKNISRKAKLNKLDTEDLKLRVLIFSFPSKISGNVESSFDLGSEGLIIEFLGYKGIIFPSPNFKDKVEFLETLCKEAGLTKDSWQNPRVLFYSFKVQEFE